MADSEGMVFDIQRFSIHDGPGIRTTVFLKGCPLRCRWCHNPEGIPPEPMLSFTPSRCVGCGRCLEACPRKAHQNRGGEHTLDRSLCQVCGRCAEACCSGALEIVGKRMSVEEVLREVLSDRAFYETSGGGMTLSGGEPLLQGDFCEALLGEAKRQGLHCCVETSGLATWELIDRLRPLVDLWLYDLKETDAQQHRDLTGVDNRPILDNLRRLHAAGAKILIRLPIVPELNATEDHFAALGALWAQLPGLLGMEVMPYHQMGQGKNYRFGLPPGEPLPQPPDEATVRAWCTRLRELGIVVANRDA